MTAEVPVLVRVLYVATVVVWLVLENRQARNTRPEARQADRGSRLFLMGSYLTGLLVGITLEKVAPGGAIRHLDLVAWVGLLVLWSGVGLRLWSFHTLGRYFTFTVQTSDDQPVITAGPYRLVRHPSYLGLLLAFAGLGVLLGNWWSLLALVVATTVGVVRRIRVEEQALSEALGPRYDAYAAAHRRLVPYVW